MAIDAKSLRCSSFETARGFMWAATRRDAGNSRPQMSQSAESRPSSRYARSRPCSRRRRPMVIASVSPSSQIPSPDNGLGGVIESGSTDTPSRSNRRCPPSSVMTLRYFSCGTPFRSIGPGAPTPISSGSSCQSRARSVAIGTTRTSHPASRSAGVRLGYPLGLGAGTHSATTRLTARTSPCA